MAKPHVRLTLDLIDMIVANNVKIWLESKLDTLGLDKNSDWVDEGEVLLFEPDDFNELDFPRILFFTNVNHTDRQSEFKDLLFDKIKEGAMVGKVKYVKIDKWMCSHDEESPQPCNPIILHEKVFE